jgi:hypothetical protein
MVYLHLHLHLFHDLQLHHHLSLLLICNERYSKHNIFFRKTYASNSKSSSSSSSSSNSSVLSLSKCLVNEFDVIVIDESVETGFLGRRDVDFGSDDEGLAS